MPSLPEKTEKRMRKKPNIIYVYADDLGRGMLSCYGQKWFKTPNIDRLADEGMRFTNLYGCAVCAPARASLLTGYHDCHAGGWSYTSAGVYKEISHGTLTYEQVKELINNTGFNEREDEEFMASLAKRAGYVTGQIGKLEWGFATTPERLEKHGWDYHYGYYDHARCHGFYPPFLFENGERVDIEGNTHADCGKHPDSESPENYAARWDMTGKAVYSQDLFNEKIAAFIRNHKDEPFLLYHPSQLPHGPTSVPSIHDGVKDVEGLTDIEKEYASMVLRLDDTVGIILDTLEEQGLIDDTVVIFASDNGHEINYVQEGRTSRVEGLDGREFDNVDYNYTTDRCGDVFNGNDGFAGRKLSSLEGGTRIPYVVRWSGIGAPGTVSEHLVANYDTMPTMCELMGIDCPEWKDGISFVPLLKGKAPADHDYVVFAGKNGPALVTPDGWKIRFINHRRLFQLFYLPDDKQEENNLAEKEPEKLREMAVTMLKACDGNYYHGYWDNHKAVTIDEYMDGKAPDRAFPVVKRWNQPWQNQT
jgi:arylsulfatase A-like enzyme